MPIRPIAFLTAAMLALPAIAQTPAAPAGSGDPPKRIRSVQLIGNQECPKPTSPEEVVVCARINEGEQYRIPKELRNEGPVAVQNQSFAAKTDRIDDIAREAGGLPDTCSPVGTGGQTGCNKMMLERARGDRRQGTSNPPR